jgi:ferric-dicitrate binding protein FerR (iron transport regulator)
MSNSEDIRHSDMSKGLFQNQGKQPDEATMYAYLNGELSEQQQHEVEQWLADESMESDAIEGLKALGAEPSKAAVTRIKTTLKSNLRKKQKRNPIKFSGHVTLVTIVVVLILCLAAYLVVCMVAK